MWCDTGRPTSSIASQTGAMRALLKSIGSPSACVPGLSGTRRS